MRMTFAAAVLAFVQVLVSSASVDGDSPCAVALRKALSSSASWTMERRLPGSVRTLVSTGTVDCVPGRGIQWRVLHPFQQSVEMTTNTMVFADEAGRCVKRLDEMPYYADIREKTDAFAGGDSSAFDGLFDLEASVLGDGGWTLTMTPGSIAMRRLFKAIELSGGQTLTNAVLRAGDGGVSSISFREIPRGK